MPVTILYEGMNLRKDELKVTQTQTIPPDEATKQELDR